MSDDPEQPQQRPEPAAPLNHVLGPRRRIIAREVQSAALSTLQPADLASLGSTLETDPPKLRVRPEPLVLDPTARIGERHRKHSHQRGYRITAAATAVAFVAACAAIALLLMDRLTIARLVAVAAVATAVAAVQLSRTSPLAARLRGYAIAATVLATLALGINLAGHMISEILNETKTTVAKPAPH